ncbi:MAG: hypothetical protein K6F00_03810 [Lachnospiraceae bacterium]|nr:hypothetical protein [Lachnospiraceae bacterium]
MYDSISGVLYWIAKQILHILNLLERMFDVFAGGASVVFDGEESYLTNLFFTNDSVSTLYMTMACVGMALSVGFAVAALVRKVFDVGGIGGAVPISRILKSLIISVGLIIITNTVTTLAFNATNMLLSYISYASSLETEESPEIEFTDKERSAMARALNTLGNYSLNEPCEDVINVNMCFNEMRPDLLELQEDGVFDAQYYPEENGETWQSVLAVIAGSHDLNTDVSLTKEDKSVKEAILKGMQIIKTVDNLTALETFKPMNQNQPVKIEFDRLMFLMSTMNSARNEKMNENPSVTDPLRNAFLTGVYSIYDDEAVNAAFDINKINWILFYISIAVTILALTVMLFNCITRIFSMIFLYIVSPAVFATMPFDDGGRTKEWINMFLVQTLAVFATVLPMKLVTLFVPIILDSRLTLFENGYMNQMAKLILLLGALEAARRTSTMFSKLITNAGGKSSIGAAEIKMMGKSVGKNIKRTMKRMR